MKKRILSIILTLALALSLLPTTALAAEGTSIGTSEFTQVESYYYKASTADKVTVEGDTVTITENGVTVTIKASENGEEFTWTSKADSTTFSVMGISYVNLSSGAVTYDDGPTVTHGSGTVSVTNTYVSLDGGEKATIDDLTYEVTSGGCYIYTAASGDYVSGDISLYNTSLTVSETVDENEVSATYTAVNSSKFVIGEDPSTITLKEGSITTGSGTTKPTYTPANDADITIEGCNTETPYFAYSGSGSIKVESGSTVYFQISSDGPVLSATAADGASATITGGKVTVAGGTGTVTLSTADGTSNQELAAGTSDVTYTPVVNGSALSLSLTAGTVTITGGQSVTFENSDVKFTYKAGDNSSVTVSRASNLEDYDTVTVDRGSVTITAEGYTAFSGPATYEKEGDPALEFKFHHDVSEGVEVTEGTASIGAGTYYLYNKKYVTVSADNTATVTSAGVTPDTGKAISISEDGSNTIMTVTSGESSTLTADTAQEPVAVSGENGTIELAASQSVTIDGQTYTAGENSGTITIANGVVTAGEGITAGSIIINYGGTQSWTDANGVTYTALEAVTPANIELTPNDNGTVSVALPQNNLPIEITKDDVAQKFMIAAGNGGSASLSVDSDGDVTLTTTDTNGYLSVYPGSTITAGGYTFQNTSNANSGIFAVNSDGALKFTSAHTSCKIDGTTEIVTTNAVGGGGTTITAANGGTLTNEGGGGVAVNGLGFSGLNDGTFNVTHVFDGTPYLTAGGVQVSDGDTTDSITELKLYFPKGTSTTEYDSISSTSSFGYSTTTGLAATDLSGTLGEVTVNSGVTILVNGNYVTGPCKVSKETYSENAVEGDLTGLATVTATGAAKIGDGITLTNGSAATIEYSDSAENPGDVNLTSGKATLAATANVIYVNGVPVSGPATVSLSGSTATVTATSADATVNNGITLDTGAKVTFTGDEDVTLTNGSVTLGAAGGKINVDNYTVDGINTKITAANGSYTIVDNNTAEGAAQKTTIKSESATLLTIQNATVTIKDDKITLDAGSVELGNGQSIIVSGITVNTPGIVTVTDGRAGLTANGTATVTGTYGQKHSELTVTGLTATIGTTSTTVNGTWALTSPDTVPGANTTSATATFTPSTNTDKFAALTKEVTLNITKATPTVVLTETISESEGAKTVTLTATVTGVDGAEAPTGNVTFKNGQDALANPVEITNGKATYEWTPSTDDAYTITAEYAGDTNYNSASDSATFDTSKQNQAELTIAVNPATVSYGETLTLGTTGGSTDGVVTYMVHNESGEASIEGNVLTATKVGTVQVTAVMAGNDAYNEVHSAAVTITITKADPTGTPTYTAITAAGKTLADAALGIGSITPAGGTIVWDVGDRTTVEANTPYSWTYTPSDTGNYNTLTGSITPYVVNDDNTGNGGNDGGGGYTPSTPPTQSVTVPISGDDNTIYVGATVSGDKATIKDVDLSKLDTVIGDHVDTGTVTIDFSGLKTSKPITTVEIPSNVVKEIAAAVSDPANDAHSFEVILSDGTSIEFDAEALGEKAAQADGLDITISIKQSSGAGKQQSVVGTRTAYDINVTSGGEHISDMGGMVTVHAPYELKDGELPRGIIVYYVDDNGNKEACVTSYDSVKKRVNWKTDHLSLYMIDYDEALANNPFTDVSNDAYYFNAVLWAVDKGITNGTSATTFSPDASCTRAQMATFLWRAAGSPDPVGSTNPFTDVSADAYYAKAVQWAVEQGITVGTSDTTFSPDADCTRAQMATFLWRNAGSPATASVSNPFTDVPAEAYYAAAVQWAYEQEITGGTSATTFSPNNICTRAQMVTFLYRYFVK